MFILSTSQPTPTRPDILRQGTYGEAEILFHGLLGLTHFAQENNLTKFSVRTIDMELPRDEA